MNKIIFSLLAFASISLPAYAADEVLKQPEQTNVNSEAKKIATDYKGLGISAGAISGVGFSYRQFFYENYGFKTSAVIYMDDNQNFFNVGLQGIKVLSGNDWLRFYAIGGLSDFSFKYYSYIYDQVPPVPEPKTTTNNGTTTAPATAEKPIEPKPPEKKVVFDTYVNLGAGIGIEIGRKEQGLSLAIELPLVLSIKNYNKINFIYPIPQISLIYNF
jgi:hypothetical protein